MRNVINRDLTILETTHDYDNSTYKLYRGESEQYLLFGFSCNCSQQILENGGQEMLDELYADFKPQAGQALEGCDVTLAIDVSKLPQTQKLKKSMSEEEQNAIRASNEEVKKQRVEAAENISNQFSKFKRDFIGAPIRRALKGIQTKSGNPAHSCEINYRSDESFWVQVAPAEVTISFGLNFDNKEDKALARIFLLEFVDSRKHVKQPPAIVYHDTNYPPSLTSKFPSLQQKKFTNGIIQFTLFENHTKPNMDQPITFLVGFRQFLHYHFHFIKATLHMRMRKRVDTFQRVMTKAKRDQDQGQRVYKQTHGGAMIVDVKEEKKQEEIFKYQQNKKFK